MISVVIPVLDEEAEIGPCVESLRGASAAHEVLVVDGGSGDRTRENAAAAGARVLDAPRGRARQQNLGAAAAAGDVLLFLHADMRLPAGGLEAVDALFDDPRVVGGGFHKRYVPQPPLLAAVAWLQNHLRAGWLKNLVGTNAMFVRRDTFEALGGFPETPFMEDVLLCDALKAAGRLEIVPREVEVSARKYTRDGSFRRLARNLWILFQFRALGKTPEELAGQY